MAYNVDLHEDVADQLSKYCNRSTANLERVVERFLKSWYSKPYIQKQYVRDDELKERTGNMARKCRPPENKITGVTIDSSIGRSFRKMCEYHGFDPTGMASYLGALFVDAHGIEKMNETKKERGTDKFGDIYGGSTG